MQRKASYTFLLPAYKATYLREAIQSIVDQTIEQNNYYNRMTQRLLYPDICKFIAIFIVTWGHCAQCISGEVWTHLWGGEI